MTKSFTHETWIAVSGGTLALSHRPKLAAFEGLRARGCTALLTLLSEREGANAIGAAAARTGIEWVWLALKNGNPPPESRDADVRAALDAIAGQLNHGGGVLI